MTTVLDNAAWFALTGPHAHLAEGSGVARKYPSDVSPFFAIPDDSEGSWAALADLATDEPPVLFRAIPTTPPHGWETLRRGGGFQMTLTQAIAEVPALPRVDPHSRAEITLRILDVSDIPAMTALVELAQPGPWLPRTQSLGGYVGIFHDTTLVAMAGQRLQPPGYCEISAVCTHPDARRRGYASIVTAAVAAHISERGDTPFLHLAATNTNALAAYLQLGFVVRTETEFVVVRAPSGPTSASE